MSQWRTKSGDPLPVDDLQDRYSTWRAERVYEWEAGRPTFRLTDPAGEIRYLKITPAGGGLPDEATKLRWAADWIRVPSVIEYGSDGDLDWLMTSELAGVDASVHPLRDNDPGRLAGAFGRGLRALHDAIPVDECPFDLRLGSALRQANARAEAGLIDPAEVGVPAGAALARVADLMAQAPIDPYQEDLVVCHGDYCLPNAFLTGGKVTGYLDLGALAVADRWLDLAVALRSLSAPYNLGPGHERAFLDAYGIELDERKRALYLLLYDLAS